MRLLIVVNRSPDRTTTFIRNQIDCLDGKIDLVCGFPPMLIGQSRWQVPISLWSLPSMAREAIRRATRAAGFGLGMDGERKFSYFENAYRSAMGITKPDVVLAEYGTVGARVLAACQGERVPLVVHFHGHDATRRSIIESHRAAYREMFEYASAIVAVSSAMKEDLIALGCNADRISVNPYGVDLDQFQPTDPSENDPVFLAVGRFVPKKSPGTTVKAFAMLSERCPNARMRMIGDGPLLNKCRELAVEMGLGARVDFPGTKPHQAVVSEMRRARCFVQHSIRAEDGDCEGTPNAILEASASGLPVVATRHGGIPEAVVDGRSGILVGERDVNAMADAMIRFAESPELARQMGRRGREYIEAGYSIEDRIAQLNRIIEGALIRPRADFG